MSNYFSVEAFDYDDIQLVPNKGIIKSRHDADTSVKFGNRTFKIPVVPANMESVINDEQVGSEEHTSELQSLSLKSALTSIK